jgi:hypothetical protein
MSSMTDALDGLWSWCLSVQVEPGNVRSALSSVLQRPVTTLEVPVDGAALCDVWTVGGDYPTLMETYLVPGEMSETAVAVAVAARLGADVLVPDDTLNPTRYLRAAPDGTLAPVHVDETETDDGPERRRVRPCTGSDPACALHPGCGSSRWKPTGRPAAAQSRTGGYPGQLP